MKRLLSYSKYYPYLICTFFFIAYALLSIHKHNSYLSGYDLGISDQAIWLMSHFKNPVSTSHAYAFTSLFADHVEIIYALLSPLYWFQNDVRLLLLLQAFAVTFSAIPLFLLAKEKKIHTWICYALLISFLLFYGIQNALWADVHSLAFAAALIPWHIYMLEKKNTKWTWITFVLLLTCKEDIALITLLINFVYFVTNKQKIHLILMLLSVFYLVLLFGIYYPYFTPNGYRFAHGESLVSRLQLSDMYNTPEKKSVLFYSFAWFGGIPLITPLYLLPALTDLAHYFVIGKYVTSAQGMFLHYRVTLASLLLWPTIYAIAKYKRLNTKYVALYILFFALLFQYQLHLPLSYLTKQWFWTQSQGVKNIESLLPLLPADAAVVSQVNITPHINHREIVITLWPEKKAFTKNSPCGGKDCDWFHWAGDPEYLLADTSPEWDARHLLTNNENFKKGITNLERAGVIKKYKQHRRATLYIVLKKP
jgi:uncharacterized membrane protein